MGRQSKARRDARAKARARSNRSAGHRDWGRAGPVPPPGDEPFVVQSERARGLLMASADARRMGSPRAELGIRSLATMAPGVVDQVAEDLVLVQVGACWAGGWQPSELLRQGRRGTSGRVPARLVAWAMATDHVGRRSATLDRRWAEQVESLELPAVSGRSGWLSRWAADEGLDRAAAVVGMVEVLACLTALPRLDPILPRPGSGPGGPEPTPQGSGTVADPMLVRIRNLLAKAESTTFEAEAMALTAKAHELMTRHAIDAAQLDGAGDERGERPSTIRLPIDAPYADAKSLLMQVVAEAGRCRAVFHSQVGLSTVVGFEADLAGVEMLFTSLLVQVQSALAEASRNAPAGTRTRSQSYRSAFLLSYANRIGERLEEVNSAVVAEAEAAHGGAFLPVLRSRSDAVDADVAERFGELVTSSVRGGWDAAGWAGGQVAADNAKLAFGDLEGAR